MPTKKTIAIIGATGNTGAELAKNLAKGCYRLLLMAGNTEKSVALCDAIKSVHQHADVEVIECAKEACWEADMIIAATPYGTEKEVAQKITEVATGKIVICIASPLDEIGTGAAEVLQKLLPYSKVVQAFHSSFAPDYKQPFTYGETPDCLIKGNDREALETVSDMVYTVGFNPVIDGGLPASLASDKTIK